jgi:hypothetical protein
MLELAFAEGWIGLVGEAVGFFDCFGAEVPDGFFAEDGEEGCAAILPLFPEQLPAALSLWEQVLVDVGVEFDLFDSLDLLGCDRLGSPLIYRQFMNDCCDRMQLLKG